MTVEEKGDEERTEGKREAERDTKHFPNDARRGDTGGERGKQRSGRRDRLENKTT